ncbi:ribonuclease HII [Candidatus Blochmanniella vafra str. BVAF]|uniref:Ribonuclease HII n=1 Tax=Blochmanniella vafra (strain BVAF) TaxID=859654 RepID=E8Q6T9_BLOVB|nr:ribonuclease HII [Candidatus Blochmannia vafer]ADV33686.1 ribonuclease HII [Candidatus Blochmannia vafer str. BVAF]
MYKKKLIIITNNKPILIAGVDEVGCGALMGPIIASAVIFPPFNNQKKINVAGLVDSKTLNSKKRVKLYKDIQKYSLSWSIGVVSVSEIDKLNVLKARLLAMKRAVLNLSIIPDLILVDGNKAPFFKNIFYQCFIKGDVYIPIISAASIIAKVIRDRAMIILNTQYPQYGLNHNKGYPTNFHIQQLYFYGPTIYHRKTFSPVKHMIGKI